MTPLEEIQTTLIQIYTKNTNYLQKNYPNLYNQIIDFEKLNIENRAIDFIDNHFELVDKEGNKTYNCDPFYDAQYRAQNIYYLPASVHYENSINAYEQINEYIQVLNQNAVKNKDIKKFIFIGTLLGVHINDIHRTFHANSYLICEPDIEVFRLSLFLTDYTEVCSSSKVFFCINFSPIQFSETIKLFLKYQYQYNTHIQFELASQNEIELVNTISTQLAQNNQMTYPYSEYIVSMQRGYQYFQSSENGILNINNLNTLLKDKPVLYIGAGSSVAKELEWIYTHQDRFIIVVAAGILKRLELLSIIPDIIITIDGQDIILKQFEVNEKMYNQSIILSSIKLAPMIYDKINSSKLFFIQDSFELFENYGILTGVTVGDIGISLLFKLGAQKLYLLGFDASINHKTGKTGVVT